MKVIFVISLLSLASAYPAEEEEPNFENGDPMLREDLFEGDIVIDDNLLSLLEGRSGADSNPKILWPKGVVPYSFAPQLGQKTRNLFHKAVAHIQNKTCLQFRETSAPTARIVVYPGKGCNSNIGRTGRTQTLNLQPNNPSGCEFFGTIVHEILHAVGFLHEHTRSDRDSYVRINWNNIKQKAQHNFRKRTPSQNHLYGGFDYYSLMMYTEYAFRNR
uniref:Metalloendopeptidase n=1 Tax=Plectreurys tristis TaxID=33319 RepID=A0A0C4W5U2_PLETR|nr:astacin-like protein [Plectreurys tristis]